MKEAQREQFATLTLNDRGRPDAGGARAGRAPGSVDEQALAAARRDARALPGGGRARLRRPPGLHARIGSPAVRLFDRAVVRVLPAVPRAVVRRVAAPYIAGETLDDARRVVKELNAAGVKRATVDVLGEDVSRPEEAEAIARAYHDALAAIERGAARRERLDQAHGLRARARQGALQVARRGARGGRRDARDLRPHRHGGLVDHGRHARCSIARSAAPATTTSGSCCRRPPADARRHRDARRPPAERAALQGHLRRALVRRLPGARRDPQELRRVPRRAARRQGAASRSRRTTSGCSARRSSASPGSTRARTSCRCCSASGRGRGRELVAAGHPLRVYVPYGLQWYEYSLRRLQENPKVAGYVARDVVGRIVPGRGEGS